MDTAQEVVTAISSQFQLTDAEIAIRVSSSQPTIWRLRTGRTKDCSAGLYRGLCHLHKVLTEKRGAGETAVNDAVREAA